MIQINNIEEKSWSIINDFIIDNTHVIKKINFERFMILFFSVLFKVVIFAFVICAFIYGIWKNCLYNTLFLICAVVAVLTLLNFIFSGLNLKPKYNILKSVKNRIMRKFVSLFENSSYYPNSDLKMITKGDVSLSELIQKDEYQNVNDNDLEDNFSCLKINRLWNNGIIPFSYSITDDVVETKIKDKNVQISLNNNICSAFSQVEFKTEFDNYIYIVPNTSEYRNMLWEKLRKREFTNTQNLEFDKYYLLYSEFGTETFRILNKEFCDVLLNIAQQNPDKKVVVSIENNHLNILIFDNSYCFLNSIKKSLMNPDTYLPVYENINAIFSLISAFLSNK